VTDIEPEDIAAVRREDGGLRALMRAQIAIGQARRTAPPKAAAPRPPGHRPGVWPSGTSPPGPLRPQPPGAWPAALDRHRDGSNAESDPCHCGGCQPPNQPEENL
jgi:hypothetical protein